MIVRCAPIALPWRAPSPGIRVHAWAEKIATGIVGQSSPSVHLPSSLFSFLLLRDDAIEVQSGKRMKPEKTH